MRNHPTPQSTDGRKTVRTRRKPSSDPELQELFDRFTEALTEGNGRVVADMWETPAYFIGDEMIRCEEDPREVEKFFGAAKDMYEAKGITHTRAELGPVDWLTDKILEVDVRFPYLDRQGNELGEESSRYTVRRAENGEYRLCVAVMRGES